MRVRSDDALSRLLSSDLDEDMVREDHELATVGGLLVNELVDDSRRLLDKPMAIHLIEKHRGVVPHKIGGADGS